MQTSTFTPSSTSIWENRRREISGNTEGVRGWWAVSTSQLNCVHLRCTHSPAEEHTLAMPTPVQQQQPIVCPNKQIHPPQCPTEDLPVELALVLPNFRGLRQWYVCTCVCVCACVCVEGGGGGWGLFLGVPGGFGCGLGWWGDIFKGG